MKRRQLAVQFRAERSNLSSQTASDQGDYDADYSLHADIRARMMRWPRQSVVQELAVSLKNQLWSKEPGKLGKRILLVTDIPPSTNYTGGIFTGEMLESVDLTIKDIFVLLDRYVKPHVPSALKHRLNMRIESKPIEQYHPGANPEHSESRIHYLERLNTEHIERKILPSLLKFAARSRASAFWILLEGQSMIRLAHALLGCTQLPVHVQVMDPPASWLRAKGLDPESTREVEDKFAAVMGRARSCAAGSWAMAERYYDQFGIRCVPVLPSLPASLARPAAQGLGEAGSIRVGFAGQIYARQEWDTLLTCLDSLQWRIGEREIELHAFPHQKPEVLDRHTNRIQFHPWLPTSDLIDALSACDLTYCAYWFDEGFREDAELCFPAKISTYLAAGRPILFHGPAYASPSRFLAEWKAGFVCNSPDPEELAIVLRRALTDRPLYASAARNGRLAFNQCLTRDRLAHSVREFLDLGSTAQVNGRHA